MYMKIHKNAGGTVVAVCDEDLIGRVLESKYAFMDLDKYRNFYIGAKTDQSGVKEALESFSSINLVGNNSVKIALDAKIIKENEVKYINDVPYIQIYRI